MLVFGDAGKGYRHVAVIHHRAALVVAVIGEPFEVERPVRQAAEFEIEIAIERTGVKDVSGGRRFGAVKARAEFYRDIGVIEDALDHVSITAFRHALIFVEEVIVVVIEAHGQAFQDRGRQFRRRAAPLLFGISLEEGLIEIAADEAQRLLLEGLWIGDRFIGLVLDEGSRFIGPEILAEELVDRVQIDGKGVDLLTARRFDAVLVGHEGLEAVHVVPDFPVVRYGKYADRKHAP